MNNVQNFLKKRYDSINNRTIFYENDERIRAVLSLIDSCDKAINVLDIGCYNGEIAKKIKEKIGKNANVYGIDVADNLSDEVRKRGINYKVNDLNKGIDFENNKFDIVFSGEIIEHLYDTDFFISEVKRVLKPGGILIITTPNLLSLGRRLCYLFGIGIFMEASLVFPINPPVAGHIRFFTKKLLVDFMEFNNFELKKYVSDTVNFPMFKCNFLVKIFPFFGHSIICKFKNIK